MMVSTDLAIDQESKTLQLLINGRRMIERAKSIQDVREIRDQAQAIAAYLKQHGEATGTVNAATEIKIVAERNMGERLRDNPDMGRGGDRKSSDAMSLDSLSDLGIEKKQSSRWQSIASIPEDVFEEKLAEIRDRDEPMTTAAFLRLAGQLNGTRDEPRPRTLAELIDRLCGLVAKEFQLWPAEHREVMANVLLNLGEKVLKNGELEQ